MGKKSSINSKSFLDHILMNRKVALNNLFLS